MVADPEAKYKNWTRNDLLERLNLVERELKRRDIDIDAELAAAQTPTPAEKEAGEEEGQQKSKKARRRSADIDPSKYSTRFIALKLAYLGKNYGGFEFQPSADAPTIEEELWKALTTARLIFPADRRVVDFSCCEYSKCGRTDRGVSAFGQVVSLRVRSNRPLPKPAALGNGNEEAENAVLEGEVKEKEERPFDDTKDEIRYITSLNKLLPPDIRILAWCPSPPEDFSARFSCRERRYRYFFTQPAFPPLPAQHRPQGCNGWLDIDKMREAAKLFVGAHDFRNFCKIDPTKQITNYERTIFDADVVEVKDVESALPYLNHQGVHAKGLSGLGNERLPRVYSFNVWGSAFLWHQIRCMVSILFLVGQGLETPELIRDMLDTKKTPGRTAYIMANEVPLVLWDCIFPEGDDPGRRDALRWIYASEECNTDSYSAMAVGDAAWTIWRDRKMDEVLAGQLFGYIHERDPPGSGPAVPEGQKLKPARPKVFEGGNNGRSSGTYVPVAKMKKMLPPEEQNDVYARKVGFANAEEMRSTKDWRKAIKEAKMSGQDTRVTE